MKKTRITREYFSLSRIASRNWISAFMNCHTVEKASIIAPILNPNTFDCDKHILTFDEPNEWCEKLSYVSGISNFADLPEIPENTGKFIRIQTRRCKNYAFTLCQSFPLLLSHPLLLLSAVGKCPMDSHCLGISASFRVCVPGRELGTPKELNYISIRKKNTVSTMHSFC